MPRAMLIYVYVNDNASSNLVCHRYCYPTGQVEIRGQIQRFRPSEIDGMGPVTRRDYGLDDWDAQGQPGEGGGPDGAGVRPSQRGRRKGWLHLAGGEGD